MVLIKEASNTSVRPAGTVPVVGERTTLRSSLIGLSIRVRIAETFRGGITRHIALSKFAAGVTSSEVVPRLTWRIVKAGANYPALTRHQIRETLYFRLLEEVSR